MCCLLSSAYTFSCTEESSVISWFSQSEAGVPEIGVIILPRYHLEQRTRPTERKRHRAGKAKNSVTWKKRTSDLRKEESMDLTVAGMIILTGDGREQCAIPLSRGAASHSAFACQRMGLAEIMARRPGSPPTPASQAARIPVMDY